MKAAHLKSSLSMMGNVLQEYWFCDQVFFSWITILNVTVQILIWLVYHKFFFEKENYQSKIASTANIWRNEIITLTLFQNLLVIQLWLLGADWKNCYIEDVISFKVLTEDLCTIIFERMKLSTETCALYLFCKWWANESFLKDTTPRTSVRGSDWFFLNLQEYYWCNLSLRPPLLVLLSAGEKQSSKGNDCFNVTNNLLHWNITLLLSNGEKYPTKPVMHIVLPVLSWFSLSKIYPISWTTISKKVK